MEENYPKINISEIYRALKFIDSVKKINLFDEEDIDDDIGSSDSFILENIIKINKEIDGLNNIIEKNDEKLMRQSLISLRVSVMNVASEFDSLRESMDDLLKAL